MKDLQELQALHLKSTRNLVKLGACGGAPANRSKWNVPVSEFAQLTHNPIRAIVEGLKIVPNPEKPLIALSIVGQPGEVVHHAFPSY
ncbi:hypothetical protein pipiens_017782 [Culex pipiens pipiens]|uniref:Uncharacterized protein n=1 Tax=Culex pipiens pipiens TaxID=38569 RepID=A0ABD1CG44_CULPP